MFGRFLLGSGYPLRGLSLLKQPGIRRFVIIPLTINTLLFAGGLYAFFGNLLAMTNWVNSFLPSWLHWLQWLLAPLLILTVLTTLFFTFSMMTNLLAAPFNSLLAEQVEYHLTGRYPSGTPFTTQSLLVKTIPLLGNELNKILYSLLWMIPFLLLFILPVVHLAAPFLWLLYSAWMLAVQYLDLPMGNHEWSGRRVRQALRQQRALSLGFGGMVLLLNTIPLINFLAMPACVVGATLLWVEQLAAKEGDPV
ncbi:sulfate transporter CysZ [Candidatus Magnetaquicoccus inordinatus]|uniref:sulfate transporter CysZ n=1 Tax=Candidatus Magnetaquicoccus inordinatus TaxID=2496818 RepID=UPI00102B22CF|nr:sulfate transporter CysZ [Candidatus Magnetaquicoccus inordinatus]